jgi:hypothetical protein
MDWIFQKTGMIDKYNSKIHFGTPHLARKLLPCQDSK